MEMIVAYLVANPETALAVATLVGSLGVAVSNAGGEKFALARRLFRLVTSGKDAK